MAYKRKTKAREPKAKPASDDKKKLLLKARKCYRLASEADQENRSDAIDDIRFVNEPGAQWDANMKKERGDRPCYEFNKCRINGKKVINEIRANRPQGKIRATEGGDKEIAEIYEGLARNIWASSDGDTIIDNAAEYQVDGGMTAWRVITDYSDDTAFDQDIAIEGFKNPLCVYVDPNCKDILKRDAAYWLVTERIANEVYEERWPKAKRSDFESLEVDEDEEDWRDEETTRICEYWYKEPYDKEIWLVNFPQESGETRRITVDSTSDEANGIDPSLIERRRTVHCDRVMMCILSGDAILEGPVEWAGSMFPFVMVYGEHKVIDGKFKWWGLHRFARDAQQSYNVSRTAIDETIAQAPQAKYWATPEQASGHTAMWGEAHRKNFPFLLYNHDPKAPAGAPQRMGGAEVPVALIQQAQIAAQDIRDVTGLHEASFGEESGEKSGIALARKQNQAQIVTYNFPDNMAKGIRRTWEILIDLIPEIYDAERELRILGSDGAEDYVKVNQVVQDPATGKAIRVNDLSMGKYDVAITVGPSWSTLRQEASEVYSQMAQADEMLMPTAGDLVYGSMDLPYAKEIAERRKLMLPPQIQKHLAEGKEIPPEAQAVMAQAEQAMQMVQQQTQLVQEAAQEVQQDKMLSDKAKADVEKAIASLEVKQAQFDADIEKKLAQLTVKESQLATREAQLNGQQEQADGATAEVSEARQAVADIDEMVAQFMQAIAEVISKLKSESGISIAMPRKSRLKGISTKRENGTLIAIPEYDGDSDEPRIARVKASRGADGSMVGVPEYEDATVQ